MSLGLLSVGLQLAGLYTSYRASRSQSSALESQYRTGMANLEQMRNAIDTGTSYNNAMIDKQMNRVRLEGTYAQSADVMKNREAIAEAIVTNAAAGYTHGSMDNFVDYQRGLASQSQQNVAISYASNLFAMEDQKRANQVQGEIQKATLMAQAGELQSQYDAQRLKNRYAGYGDMLGGLAGIIGGLGRYGYFDSTTKTDPTMQLNTNKVITIGQQNG